MTNKGIQEVGLEPTNICV